MIFVTVGSTDFEALVQKMDELAPRLGEEVVMQTGLGTYRPSNSRCFAYASSLDEFYAQASLIVAHGGLGTIVEALEREKRLVCVVNPATYDHHQEHLLRTFEAQNYLVWCKDLALLAQAIAQARTAQFERYRPPECRIHVDIAAYLSTGQKPRPGADL